MGARSARIGAPARGAGEALAMPVLSRSSGVAKTLCIGASLLFMVSLAGCSWLHKQQAEDAEAAAARSQASAARAEAAANKALESSAAAMKAADHAVAAVKEATKEMDRVSAHLEQMERDRDAEEGYDEDEAPRQKVSTPAAKPSPAR